MPDANRVTVQALPDLPADPAFRGDPFLLLQALLRTGRAVALAIQLQPLEPDDPSEARSQWSFLWSRPNEGPSLQVLARDWQSAIRLSAEALCER